MGGTIKYVTNQPNLTTFSGYTVAGTSYIKMGGPGAKLQSVINVPIVDNRLGFRAGVFYDYTDGYIDRYAPQPQNILAVSPGPPLARNVNTARNYGGRVALRVQATDWLTITPSALIQRSKYGGDFSFDTPPGSYDNPVQSRLSDESFTDNMAMYALNVNAAFDKLTITSSTSYFERENDQIQDAAKEQFYLYQRRGQTRVYPVVFNIHFPNHNFTEELRASFKLNRVAGVFGAYYNKIGAISRYERPVPDGYYEAFGDFLGGATVIYGGSSDLTTISKAAFGQVDIKLTEKLTATLGGRAFEVDLKNFVKGYGAVQGNIPSQKFTSTSASGFTPKYGLSYTFSDDLMAYAIASKGFRRGGSFVPIPYAQCQADLNAIGIFASPSSYAPDTLWNYEVGTKSQWLNRRLTINSDVYLVKWKDVQQGVRLAQCNFGFTGNFGTATSKGVELQVEYLPVDSLRFQIQGSYSQAQLTSDEIGVSGKSGQELPYSPKWTGSGSVEYRRPISSRAKLVARLDVNTVANQFRSFDVSANNYAQAAYTLANVRLTADAERWSASLFCTNLLDRRASDGRGFGLVTSLPNTYRASLVQPRTIGVQITRQY